MSAATFQKNTNGIVHTIEPAQHTVARFAGFLYLLQMTTGVFGFYAKEKLIVSGNAARTAENIVAFERLFRISIVADLITALVVVVLLWALYVILKPVNANVALLAAFLRLAENSIAAAGVINSFAVLRLLDGTSYLRVFEREQLQVLARVFLGGQPAGLSIAFVFLGSGSAVFSYLWLKSRYIPRALAAWGIFSSLLLATAGLVIMVFPEARGVVGMAYMAPMGLYEVGLGLWLLFKGIRHHESTANR